MKAWKGSEGELPTQGCSDLTCWYREEAAVLRACMVGEGLLDMSGMSG
jgi:hypothetical protein